MRLPTKKKVNKIVHKKESTKKEKSIHDKVKKGLSRRYMDNSEYTVSKAVVKLSEARVGIVRCCKIEEVTIAGIKTELDKSWVELLMRLMKTAHDKLGKNSFIKMTIELGVMQGSRLTITGEESEIVSSEICRHKENEEYRAYKLYDTGLVVRGLFTEDILFEAIVKLIYILGISYDDVELKVVNLRNVDKENHFWMDDIEEITEDIELAEIMLMQIEKEAKKNS